MQAGGGGPEAFVVRLGLALHGSGRVSCHQAGPSDVVAGGQAQAGLVSDASSAPDRTAGSQDGPQAASQVGQSQADCSHRVQLPSIGAINTRVSCTSSSDMNDIESIIGHPPSMYHCEVRKDARQNTH